MCQIEFIGENNLVLLHFWLFSLVFILLCHCLSYIYIYLRNDGFARLALSLSDSMNRIHRDNLSMEHRNDSINFYGLQSVFAVGTITLVECDVCWVDFGNFLFLFRLVLCRDLMGNRLRIQFILLSLMCANKRFSEW
jgi:hypothetical protein